MGNSIFNGTAHRDLTVLLMMVAACGSEDGGSNVPSGLSVRVDGEEVESGELGLEFSDVPTFSVVWDPALGSDIRNDAAQRSVSVTSASEDGMSAGPYLEQPRVEGEGASAFQVTGSSLAGVAAELSVACVPPGPGEFEAELVTTVVGDEGEHRLGMRCTTSTDYAMLPGSGLVGGHGSTSIWLTSQKRFDIKKSTLDAPAGFPDLSAYSLALGPISKDGTKLPLLASDALPLVDPVADYRYYVYDMSQGKVLPMLSKEEGALVDRSQTSLPFLNGDGSALYFVDARGAHRKRAGEPLEDFTLAAPPVGAQGAYYALHVSEDGRYLVYFFSGGQTVVPFNALWVLDTADGSSRPYGFVDASGATVPGAPTEVTELVISPDMKHAVAGYYWQGAADFWHYDAEQHSLEKIFESALQHVTTLPGSAPSIATPGSITVTPDGRYASVAINDWSGGDYWGGTKGAYVQDLTTGKSYSYGQLPNRAPISGDGWMYTWSALSPNGSHAYASVLWSGGVSRNLIPVFTIVVPRDHWTPID